MEEFGVLAVVAGLFLVVLAVLWFLLPFAVFGLKGRVDNLIKAQQETNAILREQAGKQQA